MTFNHINNSNFFATCHTLCGIIGSDGSFRQINAAWEKILGYDSHYLPKNLFLELVHAEDHTLTETNFNKLSENFENLETVTFINRFLHYQGNYREILWQVTRVTAESAYYLVGIEMPASQQTTGIYLQQENTALHDQIEQLEMTLRQAHQFNELVRQSKKEGLLDWELRSQQVHYSPSWKQLVGDPQENLTSINGWYSRIHPSDYPKVSKDIKNYLENVTPTYENRHRLQHKEGSYRWILSQGTVIRDRSGQPLRFLISFTDITERKRLEDELLACQKYEQIVNAQTAAVLLIDNQGNLLEANTAALQLYGYSKEQLLRFKAIQLFNEDVSLLVNDTSFSHTAYHRHAQGNLFPVEITVTACTWLAKKYLLLTVRDITAEKHTLEVLAESEARYRLRFETQADALIIFQTDTHQIVDVNPAATTLYGYSHAEWLQLTMNDILVDVDRNLIDLLIAATQPYYYIPLHWHKRKEGTEFSVEIVTSTYVSKGNTLICAAIRDTTARRRSEQIVETTQIFANELIQSAPVFLAVFSPEGKISLCNEAFQRAVGYSLEELVGKDYNMLLPPHEHSLIAENLSALLTRREKTTFLENSLLTKRGQLLRVEWHASIIVDEHQQIIYILGIGIDISQRKKVQSQLRLFKRIVEVSHEAIAINNLDGQLIYANQAHARLFNYDSQQLRQYNYRNHCTPATLHKIDHEVARSIAIGKTWEGILEIFDANGQQFPVWGRFDVVRDEKGKILFSFGLMHDASEQQALQTKLRYEHEQYETIFNAAPLMIIYKDTENRVIRVNEFTAKLLNTTPKQLQGKSAYELMPTYAEQYFQNDLEVIRTGQPKLGIVEEYGQGYVQTYRIPYHDTNSKILGVIVFAVDVTQRVKMEQLLKQKHQILIKREKHWRQIIDNLPIMAMAVDSDNNIVLWNQACERVTGYVAEKVVNNSQAWALLYPQAAYREHLISLTRELSPLSNAYHRWEWPLTCEDGAQKTIIWSLATNINISGILALATGEQLAEEKQKSQRHQEEHLQQILQKSVARMRFVIENLPIMVGALDEPGNIVFWNRHCEKVTGFLATEIVGNPKAWEYLYPNSDFRQKVLHLWQKVIQTQRELHRFTIPIMGKDGTEKKIAWSTLSDKIKIAGWAVWGVGIDMTAHENLLQAQKERFRHFVENLPLLVQAYDEQGQLVVWNARCEQVTGYTTAEVINHAEKLEQIYKHSPQRQRLQEKNWPKTDPYLTEMVSKDGTVKTIAWTNWSKLFLGWGHWLLGEEISTRQPSPSHPTEQLLVTVFSNLQLGVCITDGSAKFIYANQRYCQMHGLLLDNLLNQQFTITMPRHQRGAMIRDYFKFLNGNEGQIENKTVEAVGATGQTYQLKINRYRSVLNSEQAYVIWMVIPIN
jgi:PAS domain S-box-containing protein